MTLMDRPKRTGRKLLIASIGVAAISYVACGGDDSTSSTDGGKTNGAGGDVGAAGALVANLVAPPIDSGVSTGGGSGDS
jgi:hypothetical protein